MHVPDKFYQTIYSLKSKRSSSVGRSSINNIDTSWINNLNKQSRFKTPDKLVTTN